MSKIDVSTIKNVLPRDVVGEKRGKAACAAVAEYVKAQGWTGPVRYWDTDQWNDASSMVFVGGNSHGGWNGGFDTKLGNAINGRTSADVAAAKGTGSNRAADGGTGTTKPRVFKLTATFSMENGTVEFDLGEHADKVTFDSGSNSFSGITPITASTYGKKLMDVMSNPREAVKLAAECDAEGHIVKAGHAYGEYASNETDAKLAGADILRQAIAKTDLGVIAHAVELMNGELVKFTGEGHKNEWVAKYLPEPAPVEPPAAPAAPAEVAPEPQTVAMAGDGGVDTAKKTPARGKLINKK